jgi:hypothetical protein
MLRESEEIPHPEFLLRPMACMCSGEMLPSIGNAPATRPSRQEILTRDKPGRNDTPAKNGGFDQVFASAAKAGDGRRDAAATGERKSNGPQKSKTSSDVASSSPESSKPVGINNASGAGQKASQLLDLQTPDNEAAGSADTAAPAALAATLAMRAGRGEGSKQEKISPTGAKRQEENEKPSVRPSMVPGGMASGAPLDPSSVAILLGGGTARPATPMAAPSTAAPSAESSPEKEMALVSSVVPKQQPNASAAGGELAFALRLSREAPSTPGTDAPMEAAGASSSGNSFVKELETAADKTAAEIKTRIGGNESATAGVANSVETALHTPNEPGQATSAATPASKVDAPELPSVPATPVRTVRVELASEGSQRVALTLMERDGALSVSVHSADSHLVRSLQEHLPDLSTRLSEQRYQTEIWTPRVDAPDAAGAGESTHRDFQSGGGKQGGGDGNSNPDQQQGRGNREAPAWFEELAAIGKRSTTRSEYLWVQ